MCCSDCSVGGGPWAAARAAADSVPEAPGPVSGTPPGPVSSKGLSRIMGKNTPTSALSWLRNLDKRERKIEQESCGHHHSASTTTGVRRMEHARSHTPSCDPGGFVTCFGFRMHNTTSTNTARAHMSVSDIGNPCALRTAVVVVVGRCSWLVVE